MTYKEFEQEIIRMAASATDAARFHFALDTIGLLRRSAQAAVLTELTEAERGALAEILADVERGSLDGLRPRLQKLIDSLCRNDVRAIEFHPDITELLCAIDSLLDYANSKNPGCIGRIAISMVNSIDHTIGGDSEGYSIHDMMAAEQMRSEYARQKGLLVCP
jgi:hypothetical protein